MALSGSFYKTFKTGYRIQIEWSAAQNISNNNSTITAKFYLISLGSSYTISSSANKTGYIEIAGNKHNFSGAGLAKLNGNQKKKIATATRTVNHNSDGTLKTNIKGSFDIKVTLSGTYFGTVSVNKDITLNTIPRASNPTLNSGSVNYGSKVTIYTNRASSSFTHRLRYNWNGRTGTIASNVGTSYEWTVPSSFMNYIPNSTSSWGTIYLDTYSSSKLIGTKTIKLKTNVPSNILPDFTTVEALETVENINEIVGLFVQSLSRIKFTITGAKGTYNSTIKNYYIKVDGIQHTGYSYTSGTINKSGDIQVTGTVRDSRGRSKSKSITINLLAYKVPKIENWTVSRCNSLGDLDRMGTYVKLAVKANISSLVNETERNKISAKFYARIRGTDDWGDSIRNVIGALDFDIERIVGEYSVDDSFDFRVDIKDKFNTTMSIVVLSTGVVTMSWSKQGVGIGKIWENGTLDIAGDIYVDGIKLNPDPGIIQLFAHNVFGSNIAPPGWLVCDGKAVSRVTYSKLFNFIGTKYGAGDGSTTFNLPTLDLLGGCHYIIKY